MSTSRIRPHLSFALAVFIPLGSLTLSVLAEQQSVPSITAPHSATSSSARQAALEGSLSKTLSGATLEGSFTRTDAGNDATKLAREKYTLGEVKKLTGDLWQIPARIQYGQKDVTLPIVLPIQWAGDTPVVVVDSLPLPGFGAVSARVMFFDGHYAGYWKHGDHGGHLFGVIHPAEDKPPTSNATPPSPANSAPPSRVRANVPTDK